MVVPWIWYSIWKFWVIYVLVSLVFHVFSTAELISPCKTVNLAVWAFSSIFFAWFHIVWHRYELNLPYFIDCNHFRATFKSDHLGTEVYGYPWNSSLSILFGAGPAKINILYFKPKCESNGWQKWCLPSPIWLRSWLQSFILKLGVGPFPKVEFSGCFLMLWSSDMRYSPFKTVSLQN